jgi:hypothetical protein
MMVTMSKTSDEIIKARKIFLALLILSSNGPTIGR